MVLRRPCPDVFDQHVHPAAAAAVPQGAGDPHRNVPRHLPRPHQTHRRRDQVYKAPNVFLRVVDIYMEVYIFFFSRASRSKTNNA